MKPYYSPDCAAKTQVQGQALSSSPVANNSNNAWIVNFNNGNDNNNNKNNNNYVRLVRSSECLAVVVPPSVCFFNDESPSFTNGGSGRILSYRALYNAFIQAKKRKKPSYNRLMFEQDWLSHLFTILTKLQQHTWQPLPSVCFVAKRPKAREIHAPDFADRVVHHWLVPHLEAIYEPIFIYDSFANRKGKGTHAAVERLQQFVRQVYSGQGKGRGYYLQLDIHNFFNSIHRPTLYGLLKAKVQSVSPFLKGGLRGIYGQKNPPQPSFEKGGSFIANKTTERLPLSQRGTKGDLWAKQIHPNPPLPKEGASSLTNVQNIFPKGGLRGIYLLHTIHALLRQHPKHLASHIRATPQELALVPPHKQLKNAAQGCGLPIGNLSSQFFANVYLNELDQFVKHTLKVKRYVRYVDDFVLVHHNKAQLQAWLVQIEQFLAQRLRLRLKADIKLQPLSAGIDFLGYWIYPTHKLVRPRVIHHAKQKLSAWQSAYVRRTAEGWLINATEQEQAAIRSVWASYKGHFGHANTAKLELSFYAKYPWLQHIVPYVAPVPTPPKSPKPKSYPHPNPLPVGEGDSSLNMGLERLPLFQRGTKGDLLARQILPNPPLPKEGDSSLTKQQSVLPFAKGGIYSPFYLINPKETP